MLGMIGFAPFKGELAREIIIKVLAAVFNNSSSKIGFESLTAETLDCVAVERIVIGTNILLFIPLLEDLSFMGTAGSGTTMGITVGWLSGETLYFTLFCTRAPSASEALLPSKGLFNGVAVKALVDSMLIFL